MERIERPRDAETMIDLGTVTDETKGPGIQGGDFVGQMTTAGLSDD